MDPHGIVLSVERIRAFRHMLAMSNSLCGHYVTVASQGRWFEESIVDLLDLLFDTSNGVSTTSPRAEKEMFNTQLRFVVNCKKQQ